MIRVGICDDDALVRRLLPESLSSADIDVVEVCASGEGVLLCESDVDVWIIDEDLSGIDGRATTRELTASCPGARVVLLTEASDDRIHESLFAGASAQLDRDATPGQLREAVRTVMNGFAVLEPDHLLSALRGRVRSIELLEQVSVDGMDRRLVSMISEGYNYGDIARELGLSISGTKKRASRLMAALEVGSRAQFVAKLNGYLT